MAKATGRKHKMAAEILAETMSPRNYDPAPLIHLAAAIVEQRAIVYVGAGASVPSGGPLWSQLLEWLCEKGAQPLLKSDPTSYAYLQAKLSTEKKYLEAADLLQEILDNDLQRLLLEKFAKVLGPSSIHVNIGRIPFRASITTNYDDLLEAACANSISGQDRHPVVTWNTPKAILGAVQSKLRYILKTHGKIDEGTSLILSSRQYRNLMYANPLYWQILKWIFMTNTCLFVGCSLTDPDLLHLFEQVITETGLEDFGPHYALLPEDEAPPIKRENLWRRWKIKVIPLADPREKVPGNSEIDNSDRRDDKRWVEAESSRVLVALAGEVAKQTVFKRPPALPTSDDHEFFLIKALEKLLQTALEVTGSFRGDICLASAGIGGRESGDLSFWVSQGPTDLTLKDQPVKRRSVCGIAYHEASPKQGVYIRDVEAKEEVKNQRLREDSDIWHWGKIDYLPGHTDVKSELALPILADGVRVGVLNLESRLKESYAEGHFTAAQWYAEKAGRLFGAAKERDRRGRGLRPEIIDHIKPKFLNVFKALWDIRNATATQDRKERANRDNLECLVFHADYINGRLAARAKSPENDSAVEVEFCFETEPSFTGTVFRERSGALCPDAARAMNEKRIARTYAVELQLSGPLIGVPIYVHGYVAGVLVCWHRDGRDGYLDWRDMELFRRGSHLIANASAKHFMLKTVGLLHSKEAAQGIAGDFADEEKRICLAIDHIEGVRETIEFCVGSKRVVDETRLIKDKDSDESFFRNWLNVARKIESLLELLWIRYGAEEKNWLVPTRARLWVAAQQANSSTGKGDGPSITPVFGLVMELSLDKEKLRSACRRFLDHQNGDHRGLERWANCSKEVTATVRNLFKRKNAAAKEARPTFLTAQPLVPGDPRADKKGNRSAERISMQDFNPNNAGDDLASQETSKSQNIDLVTVDEPNMSFLLSRQWADRFTRLQALEAGTDPLVDWMEKVAGAPVYAAPIVRMLSESFEEEEGALIIENNVPRTKLRELAGILVLDSVDLSEKAINPPTDEGQVTLHNELLHTIDLFSACLAESQEFQRNRSQDHTEQSPQPRGKPNHRATAAGTSSA